MPLAHIFLVASKIYANALMFSDFLFSTVRRCYEKLPLESISQIKLYLLLLCRCVPWHPLVLAMVRCFQVDGFHHISGSPVPSLSSLQQEMPFPQI
jgi:hypothetical protein